MLERFILKLCRSSLHLIYLKFYVANQYFGNEYYAYFQVEFGEMHDKYSMKHVTFSVSHWSLLGPLPAEKGSFALGKQSDLCVSRESLRSSFNYHLAAVVK